MDQRVYHEISNFQEEGRLKKEEKVQSGVRTWEGGTVMRKEEGRGREDENLGVFIPWGGGSEGVPRSHFTSQDHTLYSGSTNQEKRRSKRIAI